MTTTTELDRLELRGAQRTYEITTDSRRYLLRCRPEHVCALLHADTPQAA
ncbi:hypothetical protein M8Z33_07565 [Streptomyces sp. ZAF1911]|nr:hypothetical protein [Streptomyces sp. ZAF1911]MDD9376532.1 hypothetical protein [Streptomyces sp. ZAF1911]